MKKLFLITATLFLSLLFTNHAEAKSRGEYGLFYTSLAPHGMWIELDHGVVVWRPTIIRRSWAPYTQGQWIWTQDGWYWDSYEDFGYITYHYGRWFYDDYYGWIWIPDNEWAPAWVEWRYDNDYIGWAPLPPYAVFSVNIGLHFTFDYYTPYNHWHFVKYRYFCDPYVYKYYATPKHKHRIFSNTKYRNDYGYERGRVINRGVDINHIRKRTGQNIREQEIIRTSDIRDIERGEVRKNDRIRTFVASRELLNRDAGDVEIKRSDKKTRLETSKLEIGKRTNVERDDKNSRDNKEILKDDRNTRTSTKDLERVYKDQNVSNEKSGRTIELERKRITEERDNTRKSESPVIKRNDEQTNRKQIEERNSQPEKRIVQENRKERPNTERRVENQRKETQAPVIRQKEPERKVESREQKRTEPVRTERKVETRENRTETSSRDKNKTR